MKSLTGPLRTIGVVSASAVLVLSALTAASAADPAPSCTGNPASTPSASSTTAPAQPPAADSDGQTITVTPLPTSLSSTQGDDGGW